MPKPNLTEVIVILDRSGSMQSIAQDMIGGFNTFIEDQRELPGECNVTLVQFDYEYQVSYTAQPVSEVEPLSLIPRGTTALLDAIGRTLVENGERFAAMQEDDRPERVLVLIVTDGAENSSKEYNWQQVSSMIAHQQKRYSWAFSYLGANQDASKVGAALNIPKSSTVTFDATSKGARAASVVISSSVSQCRSGAPMQDASRAYAEALEVSEVALKR